MHPRPAWPRSPQTFSFGQPNSSLRNGRCSPPLHRDAQVQTQIRPASSLNFCCRFPKNSSGNPENHHRKSNFSPSRESDATPHHPRAALGVRESHRELQFRATMAAEMSFGHNLRVKVRFLAAYPASPASLVTSSVKLLREMSACGINPIMPCLKECPTPRQKKEVITNAVSFLPWAQVLSHILRLPPLSLSLSLSLSPSLPSASLSPSASPSSSTRTVLTSPLASVSWPICNLEVAKG